MSLQPHAHDLTAVQLELGSLAQAVQDAVWSSENNLAGLTRQLAELRERQEHSQAEILHFSNMTSDCASTTERALAAASGAARAAAALEERLKKFESQADQREQEILPSHSTGVQGRELQQHESREARLCNVEKQIDYVQKDISAAIEFQQGFQQGDMEILLSLSREVQGQRLHHLESPEARLSKVEQKLEDLQSEISKALEIQQGSQQGSIEILQSHVKEVQGQRLQQLDSQEVRLSKLEKQAEDAHNDISKASEIQPDLQDGNAAGRILSGARKTAAAGDESNFEVAGTAKGSLDTNWQVMGSVLSSAKSLANRTWAYAVEPNVYGLLVMPGRPLGSGAWLLLLLHYLVVFWLSYAIEDATMRAVNDLMGEIDGKLCTKVGDSWDCAEPLLKQMSDFGSLDRDGDGTWTLEEARASGLIAQFRALHEVAVESADILKVMAPPVSEVPNPFCSIGLPTFRQFGAFLGWEDSLKAIWDYLEEHDIDVGEALERSTPTNLVCLRDFVGLVGSHMVNYRNTTVQFEDVYCVAQYICEVDLQGIPARSSKDVYRSYTGYHSFFPEAIYESLMANLLQPCFLFDGDMCANAEIYSDFLRMVPRWREVDSADRVEKCASYVNEVCPRILGDQFRAFSKDVSKSCGERQYETEVVVSDVAASRVSLLNEFDPNVSCKDDDEHGPQRVFNQLLENGGFLADLVLLMDEKGLTPRSCEALFYTRWCDLNMQTPRVLPDGSTQFINFGSLVAEACPHTCCRDISYPDEAHLILTPMGCNPLCHEAAEHNGHASAIRQICFGAGCNRFSFEVGQFGQLRISMDFGWYDNEESSLITVYSNRSVNVNVIRVFAGGGPDCPSDSLQIDGTRVCRENFQQNQQVYVPMKNRNSFEIGFYVSALSHCPVGIRGWSDECNWELVIVDAGERSEAIISKLSFDQQIRFGIGPQGVRSFNYISFFFLILLVWVSFMWQELIRIVQMEFFLWECPEVGNRRIRICFLLSAGLPRFVIWFWVLRVGLSLLLASSEFVEIVLNSVALGFILDVDDILFIVMAPSYVQDAILSLDPIRWQTTSCFWKIFDDAQIFGAAFALLFLIGGMVAFEYYKPDGYLETARQVDCLCDLSGAYCLSGVLG